MTERPEEHEQVATGLRKLLNQHGHGFHFAVMRLADNLKQAKDSQWRLEGTEIPVRARGATTHIDFILTQASEFNRNAETFLVAECKRVNKKFARWCFARVPYTENDRVVFEQFHCNHDPHNSHLDVRMNTISSQAFTRAFALGLELKNSEESGENSSTGRSAIGDSVAQVLKGVSGFINYQLSQKNTHTGSVRTLRFVPAIFTTANLWVTEADVGGADIKTGDLEKLSCQKTDWLWFNHNRSPELAHDFIGEQTSSRKDLEFQFVRSVAIVNVDGIETFLRKSADELICI